MSKTYLKFEKTSLYLPQTTKVLRKFPQPTEHLAQDILATAQYKSGFSSLAGRLESGVCTGEGVDGVFNLQIYYSFAKKKVSLQINLNKIDNVDNFPPSVTNAKKLRSPTCSDAIIFQSGSISETISSPISLL